MPKGKALAPLYGSDIRRDPALPASLRERGVSLLALDPPAIARLSNLNLPFTCLDDWIPAGARKAALEEASSISKTWFSPVKDEMTIDGICWPSVDRFGLHFFWNEAAIAAAYADAFSASGVNELLLTPRLARRGSTYPEEWPRVGSDSVATSIWSNDGRFEATHLAATHRDAPEARRTVRQLASNAARPLRSRVATRALSDSRQLRGKLVVAFFWSEAHRLSPLVARLRESFARDLVGVAHSSNPLAASAVQRRWKIPIYLFDRSPPPEPEDVNAFRAALETLRQKSNDKLLNAVLRDEGNSLAYSIEERWPELAGAQRRWRQVWRNNRPLTLMTSDSVNAFVQNPVLAARAETIPTISVPHAVVSNELSTKHERMLYGNRLQRSLLLQAGASETNLLPCSDVIIENEYPVVESTIQRAKGQATVLVLFDPLGFAELIAPLRSPQEQVQTLRSLDTTPEHLRERVTVIFKMHPNGLDHDLLRGILSRSLVLPRNSPLHQALAVSDIVVVANSFGSVVTHALVSGKPVAFLKTDPTLGDIPYTEPARSFDTAGPVFNDVRALWRWIQDGLDDPSVFSGAVRRNLQFASGQLVGTHFPGIEDWWREIREHAVVRLSRGKRS